MMVIQGELVFLRPIRQPDMKRIHQAIHHEQIVSLIGQPDSISQHEVTKQYKLHIKNPARHDFAICVVKTRKVIGDLSIFNIDTESKKAQFRIMIHNPAFFNQGYGTEATLLAQDFVFKKLVLNRLELNVFSHNRQAIRMCEKTGFKKEGCLRQALHFNHQYSDEILMGMIRVDYNYSRPESWMPTFTTANT